MQRGCCEYVTDIWDTVCYVQQLNVTIKEHLDQTLHKKMSEIVLYLIRASMIHVAFSWTFLFHEISDHFSHNFVSSTIYKVLILIKVRGMYWTVGTPTIGWWYIGTSVHVVITIHAELALPFCPKDIVRNKWQPEGFWIVHSKGTSTRFIHAFCNFWVSFKLSDTMHTMPQYSLI